MAEVLKEIIDARPERQQQKHSAKDILGASMLRGLNIDRASVRVLIVGPMGVGKTSLLNMLTESDHRVSDHTRGTEDIVSETRVFQIGNRICDWVIHDTPGNSDNPAKDAYFAKELKEKCKKTSFDIVLCVMHFDSRQPDGVVLEQFRRLRSLFGKKAPEKVFIVFASALAVAVRTPDQWRQWKQDRFTAINDLVKESGLAKNGLRHHMFAVECNAIRRLPLVVSNPDAGDDEAKVSQKVFELPELPDGTKNCFEDLLQGLILDNPSLEREQQAALLIGSGRGVAGGGLLGYLWNLFFGSRRGSEDDAEFGGDPDVWEDPQDGSDVED